jgi:hypothetical protein
MANTRSPRDLEPPPTPYPSVGRDDKRVHGWLKCVFFFLPFFFQITFLILEWLNPRVLDSPPAQPHTALSVDVPTPPSPSHLP